MTESATAIDLLPYIIRTSNRVTFRRCRRKWAFQTPWKHGRTEKGQSVHLWMGTGFHYAMEDFHGYRVYTSAREAYEAYVEACQKTPDYQMPHDWEWGANLGADMASYYEEQWLVNRDPLHTLWVDGVPQVEITFHIILPFKAPDGRLVIYQGTIDRVCVDANGLLWLLDYKTAKLIVTGHLETDTQVSSYCWAGNTLFEKPIAGLVYQQHKKVIPEVPRWLQSGRYSCNKDQKTTRLLYKEALLGLYGNVEAAPNDNILFLNYLAEQETELGDKFIQRDFTKRNKHQQEAEGEKICMESFDMVNPKTAMYPNPTRDCSWDCSMREVCIMMDDGSDWEYELNEITEPSVQEDTRWRLHLPHLQQTKERPQL